MEFEAEGSPCAMVSAERVRDHPVGRKPDTMIRGADELHGTPARGISRV
jgi:hypothetical protein